MRVSPEGEDFRPIGWKVKLEFGSLTDQQPVGRRPARPWVAEVLPTHFLAGSMKSLSWKAKSTIFWRLKFIQANTTLRCGSIQVLGAIEPQSRKLHGSSKN